MKLKKPIRLLEIGTAIGYSSCVFTDCCQCQVVTIEASDDMADMAEENISNLGFADRIQVLRGDGREVLKRLVAEKTDENREDKLHKDTKPFDMVFIDAAKSHYKEFWDLSMELIGNEGMIICDNVLMRGRTASDEFDTRGRYKTSIRKMREFLTYINSVEGIYTCVLPVGDGVSISVIEK